jgi:shikimate dehydrogenase
MVLPPPQTINGSTQLIMIVGDPIAQVGSPEIINPRLQKAGVNAVLVPVHIPQAHFEVGMRGLMQIANVAGIIITVPFKHRAAAMVDRVLQTGQIVDGINALRREPDGSWTGDMFDGAGLVRAIERVGRTVAGKRTLLLGAGGAGCAIAMGFANAGARAITLVDPEAARAETLAQRVRDYYPDCAIAPGTPQAEDYDIVVNASPVGMRPGDGLPADLGPLDPATLIIDIIPKPEITPLISAARAAGCQTLGGLAMIDGQADTFLEFFRVIEAKERAA